ncbi:class I adenylate-forming enzyme family protein [Methylopila musalis]|uniref:Class I adenylate-forming enzyme family protein n=1 Tax=Methylopila musalis TaxID=1134781 RepID=A0ABW3Z358_9HYPH
MTFPLADLISGAVAQGAFSVGDRDVRLDAAAFEALAGETEADLRRLKAAPGEAVAIRIRNAPADLAAYYAAWRLGLAVTPIHVSSPKPAVDRIVARVSARIVVTDGRARRVSRAEPRLHEPDTGLIIFTSGSTGTPKGVLLGQKEFAGKLRVLTQRLALTPADHSVMPLQLTFVFGIWVSLVSILSGARLTLVPRFSPAAMDEAVRDGATVATAVPTMFRTMLSDASAYPAPLRVWITGGEPLGAALGRRVAAASPQAAIVDMYGSTETGSCDFCFDSAETPDGFGTIGRATAGVTFRIARADGSSAPLGEEGELQIRTPFGMSGYLDSPDQTAAAFQDDYYRTGDLGRERRGGIVELTGRIKDVISRGANKVAPLELDHLFEGHPAVEAALSAGAPDERLGQAIHLFVRLKDGARVTSDELKAWAAERVERFKVPDHIHVVDAIPTGSTGKGDRTAIVRLLDAARTVDPAVA